MSKTYTVKQVAEALDFSTNTVYKYLEEGRIKATRLGQEGRFRIPESEVIRLLGLKGEHAQIASSLQTQENLSEDGISLAEQLEQPKEEGYEEKLALLHKVANPDLFDWFLALTAIFLGIAYFFFPFHYQQISFGPFLQSLLILKMALVILGVALLAADIFIPTKKIYHQLLIRLPLAAVFGILTLIFHQGGQSWSASYFATLAIFAILSIVWRQAPFIKFVGFAYLLTILSGLVWAKNPTPFIFSDIKHFVQANPGVFEILLVTMATIIASLLLFTYYRSRPLLILLSWLLSGLFFLLSVGFMADQAWNKAVVTLMVGSFSLIFPFNKQLDILSKFTRREILISFSWLVLILVVGVAVIYYLQTTFRTFILEESQRRVQTAAQMVGSFVDDSIKYTNTVAQNPALEEILSQAKIDQDELESVLRTQYQGATTLKRLAIYNSLGDLLVLYPPAESETPLVNVADRGYFQQTIQQRKTIVSELVESKVINGSYNIMVATPILDSEGEILAVMGGSIDFSQLEAKLAEIEFGAGGFFALADNKKTIFIHEDQNLEGAQAIINSNLIKAVEGQSGRAEGYTEKGILSLQAYTPVDLVGWGIVAQQPVSEAFKQSSLMSFSIFLVIVLSGTGTLLATMYLKKRL